MNPDEQEFDRRIAKIHGLDGLDGREPPTADVKISGEVRPMDVRHAEFEAMAECFLGKDYDPNKRNQVEELQVFLHQQQTAMYQRYQDGKLSDKEYVDQTNQLLTDTFTKCAQVLGEEDFSKLFGATPVELAGLIDPEAFLPHS